MSEKPTNCVPRYYDDEIELRDLIRPLWQRRWLIAGIFVPAVFVAGIYGFMVDSVYHMSARFSLGKYNSPNASPAIAQRIIGSDDFIQQMIADLNLDVPPERYHGFKQSLGVDTDTDANMMNLSVKTTGCAEGMVILAYIFDTFCKTIHPEFERVQKLVDEQLATVQTTLDDLEGRIAAMDELLRHIETAGLDANDRDFRRSQLLQLAQGFKEQRLALLDRILGLQRELNGFKMAQVIRSPREPVHPISPNRKVNIALAGVLGLVVGVFLAVRA